ncbi:transmembrane protein 192 isoform X1 [Ascaphus truei]|uniref:transmembrane protein 192 isoform X1 n=1 Tax=Ascaphus truei TaxID=8439 RepID=UPI003F590F7E
MRLCSTASSQPVVRHHSCVELTGCFSRKTGHRGERCEVLKVGGESSVEITQSAEDDCFLDAPLLPSHPLESDIRPRFHPVPTVCVTVLLILLHVAYVALAFVTFVLCSFYDEEKKCMQYMKPFDLTSVLIISKVILWIFEVLYERFVQHHHSKVRNRGYLNLYRSTRQLKVLPLIVHSTGNAAVLLIISAQNSFGNWYLYVILSVLGLELILSLIFLTIYTVRIHKFNRRMPSPDIIEEEQMHAYGSNVNSEIGFREGTSLEEIVEKQGDVIEYLQQHNALLSKKLLGTSLHQN